MLKNRKARVGVWTLTLLALLMLSVPLLMGGCSGCQKKQEPPPPPPKVAQPAPAPVAEKPAAITLPSLPTLGAVVPVTLSALKLTPESAMITLALPPLQGTLDKGLALAKKLVPPGTDLDAEMAKSIAQMAQDAGVPGAKTLADIASAKGFNAEAPIALFADLTNTAASAKTALTALKADLDAQKAAPAPAAAPKAEGAAKAEAAPAAEKPAPPKAPDLDKVVASMKVPALALVLGCWDPAKVEATIGEILGIAGGYVDPSKVQTSDVGGVSVKCFDPEKLAYAVAGDKLVVSNSLDMLKQVLARVAAPAIVRYGSVECPASSPDEVVLLSRMDKIAPLAKDLLPLFLALQPQAGAGGMPEGQLDYMNKVLDALAGDDPAVSTIEWTDKKLEFAGRYDLGKHPALAELTGEAQPLRLAPMLPENTLLFLSVRLNDKTKAQIKEGWLKSLPPEVKNEAGLSKALPYVETVLSMLGDEVSLGIAGAAGGLPQVYLMAGLGNADQAKGLIQLAAPMTPSDPHEGVDISLLAIPSPVPVYIAFVDNTLMVCNDLEKLKGLIDLAKAKAPSKLFASLDPALDLTTPSFGALMLKSALVTDVVRPLTAFVGGLPPEVQGPLDQVVSVVREIRATKTLKDGWARENLTVYLN